MSPKVATILCEFAACAQSLGHGAQLYVAFLGRRRWPKSASARERSRLRACGAVHRSEMSSERGPCDGVLLTGALTPRHGEARGRKEAAEAAPRIFKSVRRFRYFVGFHSRAIRCASAI